MNGLEKTTTGDWVGNYLPQSGKISRCCQVERVTRTLVITTAGHRIQIGRARVNESSRSRWKKVTKKEVEQWQKDQAARQQQYSQRHKKQAEKERQPEWQAADYIMSVVGHKSTDELAESYPATVLARAARLLGWEGPEDQETSS